MIMNTKGWIFAAAVIGLCIAVVLACGLGVGTVVRVDTAAAAAAAEAVMECGRTGSLEEMQQYLSCGAELEAPSSGQQEAADRIRAAFFDSIRYEIPEACYGAGTGIAMDIAVDSLDISALTKAVTQASQASMERLAAGAEEPEAVLNADGTIREEVRQKVILETLDNLLRGVPARSKWVLTVQFVREDRQWKVVPTRDLLQFLSGTIPG